MLLSDAAIISYVINGHYLPDNTDSKNCTVTVEEVTRYKITLNASNQTEAEEIAESLFKSPAFKKLFIKETTKVRTINKHRSRVTQEMSRWR